MNSIEIFSEILGRKVKIPLKPERIVSLAPAITETLFLLGLDERIVAVSYFCNKPEKARKKPRIGSYFQVNENKLKEIDPDLVLVTTGAQRRLAFDLASKGYPVYPIPLPVSVPGVIDMVIQVGLITGSINEARNISTSLIKELASIEPINSNIKVYYEIDLGDPVSVGGLSYIGDALDRLGLIHPFKDERIPWIIKPDPDIIVKFNPDIIIYEKAPYKTYKKEKIISDLSSRGLDSTNAMKNNRIIILEPDSLAHYGPSLVETLKTLRSSIIETISTT